MTQTLSRKKPVAELLAHCHLLEGIAPCDLEKLSHAVRVESLHRGQTVAEEGMPAGEVYFLLRGRIELRMESLSPNLEVPVGRLGPGDTLGERLLLGEGTWPETALTTTEAEAIVIPLGALRALMGRDAETGALVHANLGRVLARRLDLSQQRVLGMARRVRFGEDRRKHQE